jgi:hypothetical protein
MTDPPRHPRRSVPVVILDAALAAYGRVRGSTAGVALTAMIVAVAVVVLVALLSGTDGAAPPAGQGSSPAAISPPSGGVPSSPEPGADPTPDPTPDPTGPVAEPTVPPALPYPPGPSLPEVAGGSGDHPAGPRSSRPGGARPTPRPGPSGPRPVPPPATPPGTPPATPPAAPSPCPEPLTARYAITAQGPGHSGYEVAVVLTNPGAIDVDGWALRFGFARATVPVIGLSGVKVTKHGLTRVLTPTGTTATVRAGRSVRVSFRVGGTTLLSPPTSCTIDGRPCAES